MKKLLLSIGTVASAVAPVAAVVACGDDDSSSSAITLDGTKAKATITVTADKASNKAQLMAITTAIAANSKVDAAEIKVVSKDGTATHTITVTKQVAAGAVTANANVSSEIFKQIGTIATANAAFTGCFDLSA